VPTRTATTQWTGSLDDGSGQVALTSSGLTTFDVSFPRRAADEAEGVTSPEELIAAAHSSCFAMQMSALVGRAGGTVQQLDVADDVTLGPDPAGGFRLTGISMTVNARVEGLSQEQVRQAAEDAKATCPVSKALTGVEITLAAVNVSGAA
jgi:osmotically inducible protein OsmC